MTTWLKGWRDRLLAWFRLDPVLVCELSRGLPPDADYHDYPDDIHGEPAHFGFLKCKRCGKEFLI